MCEVIKPRPNEIIIFNNFRALEECIAEIQENENIQSEREFFKSYNIDGEPHVLVPKNIWDKMWALFDKIESGE